jgi:hypothetical protein
MRSAGIGNHPPLLRLVGSAGAVAAAGAVGLPALAPALAVAGVAVGASGAAGDRPGPAGRLAGAALAVELDHHVGPQGGVLLLAADPLVQLGRRPSKASSESASTRTWSSGSWLTPALPSTHEPSTQPTKLNKGRTELSDGLSTARVPRAKGCGQKCRLPPGSCQKHTRQVAVAQIRGRW